VNVLAVSTPHQPGWRWRIVDYAGGTVEESSQDFSTIAQAVAEGTERLRHHADRDSPDTGRTSARSSWRRRR
jgi:hypothetical protein